jgi:Spy/CpxP family protein refolding chaperone
MRSRKRVTTIVVLALAGVALIALPAAALRGRGCGMGGGMGAGKGMGMGPTFTDEQLEQMEKIHDRYGDERAELTNRLKVIMLEAHDVVAGETPDFNAIERRIEEVAEVKVKLAKLRLKMHKEIRPLLDDDQKVLFDRGLGRMLHGGMGGPGAGHPGMMGHGGMRGGMRGGMGAGMRCGMGAGNQGMMGHGGMGGRMGGGMGGGMPGHPGMGGGKQMMTWCPFADADSDE